MKRILLITLVIVFIFSLAITAAWSQPCETYGPTINGKLQVQGTVFRPNSIARCTGRGFSPGADVCVLFDGNPVGQTQADGKGRAHYAVTIPDDAGKGMHTISFQGAKGNATLVLRKTIMVMINNNRFPFLNRAFAIDKSQEQQPISETNLLPILLVGGIAFTAIGFGIKALKK